MIKRNAGGELQESRYCEPGQNEQHWLRAEQDEQDWLRGQQELLNTSAVEGKAPRLLVLCADKEQTLEDYPWVA